jgi:hypothetical protein
LRTLKHLEWLISVATGRVKWRTSDAAAMDQTEARGVLGVDSTAEWAAVRLAYKKLALKLHPDKNPGDATAAAKFGRLREAYDALEKAQHGAEQRASAAEAEGEAAEAREAYEERMRARATVDAALRRAEEEAKMAIWAQQRARARANAPVARPSIQAVDEASVTVAWVPPDAHLFGATAVFELQLCLVHCPDGPQSAWAYIWQTVADALAQTSARKKNLRAGHAYVFRVRAQNEEGVWSQFSEPSAPAEPGAPAERADDPASARPAPPRARAADEPCSLLALAPVLAPALGGTSAWQLQYRALRGLWIATAPPDAGDAALDLVADGHALCGLHERAQYALRARARLAASGAWTGWSAETAALGVRPPADAKPRATGLMRAAGKALLSAGLRASAKPAADDGVKAFADGSTYRGPLVAGLAHGGGGELRLASGALCAGAFELDVLHGPNGRMLEPDGESTYLGGWAAGARHGRGEQTWASGPFVQYAGEWVEGKFHGQGTLTLRTGEIYTGGWAAGVRSGAGDARRPSSGEWYRGHWQNDRYAGKGAGRFIFADKSVYEGETVDGGRHGEGVLIVPPESAAAAVAAAADRGGGGGAADAADDAAAAAARAHGGWTYKGSFHEGEVHGRGELAFADGRRHVGHFAQGRKHGKGRFSWAGGDSTEGAWDKGELVGDCHSRVTYGNGDVYEGGMRAGSQEGTGTYTRASGHTYSGQWRAGMRAGRGKARAPNGDWYDGQWERDEQKGKGRGQRTFPQGVYEGALEDGQLTGKGTFKWLDGRKYEVRRARERESVPRGPPLRSARA